MNWLTAKQVLQKAWFYIKNYWWVGALIALGFVLHKFFLFDKGVLGGLYKDKTRQNKEELKVLNKAHKQEKEEKERVRLNHKLIIDTLEKARQHKTKQVNKEESKRIKEIITIPEEDRVEALAEEFGLEVIKIKGTQQ
tara:strand:+ start:4175 stop:4588 length:414 start_codon:yes stop_codon:yes gene_type:complete